MSDRVCEIVNLSGFEIPQKDEKETVTRLKNPQRQRQASNCRLKEAMQQFKFK